MPSFPVTRNLLVREASSWPGLNLVQGRLIMLGFDAPAAFD